MEVEEVRQSVSLLSDVSMDEINRDISEVRAVYAKKAAARRPLSSSRPEQPANGSPSRTDLVAPDSGNGRSGSVTNPMHTVNSGSPQPYAKVPRPPSPDAQDSATQHKPTLTRRAVQSIPFHDDEEEQAEEEEPFDVIQRLESGHNYRGPTSTFSRTRGNTKGILHRSLSMAARDPEHIPSPQLLAYVRSTFLSMVRVRYWNDIERGKIPRKSKAGKFLLYSVEVGIDEAHLGTDVGMRDWVCIEEKLNHYPLEMKVLQYWEDNTPNHWLFQGPSDYLNVRECRREERMVYILTSFIAAHESAERKIHGFLQVDGEEDYLDLQSSEELKVIAESKLAVKMARRRLEDINPDTVAAIRTKQAGALILTRQADTVKEMVQEGLITQKDAEEIIQVINSDMQGINRKRNLMYMQHGASTTYMRKNMRKIEARLSADILDV
uniref:Uncharacterized protein n=1 Tax=Spumella elongata TaxID=89044 RepID=A0A7S3GWZ5_9STRA